MYPAKCWHSGLNLALLRLIGQRVLHFRVGTSHDHDPPPADSETAARKLIEIANAAEAMQDGEHPHRADQRAVSLGRLQPRRVPAGLDRAISRAWLWRHESGTYVKFTEAGPRCSLDQSPYGLEHGNLPFLLPDFFVETLA